MTLCVIELKGEILFYSICFTLLFSSRIWVSRDSILANQAGRHVGHFQPIGDEVLCLCLWLKVLSFSCQLVLFKIILDFAKNYILRDCVGWSFMQGTSKCSYNGKLIA